MENLHFAILVGVVILALVTIYIGNLFFKNKLVFKLQKFYLLYIISHCLFAIIFARLDIFLIVIGMPFSLFYAPFFYAMVVALVYDSSFKLCDILIHFSIGFLFLLVFLTLLICGNKIELYMLTYYISALYLVTAIQLILYAVLIYLKFNKVAKDSKMISFMNQSIIIMIVSALVFSGLVLRDKSDNIKEINGFVLYVLMLYIVLVNFKFSQVILLKKVRFYKKDSKKEYFTYKKNEVKVSEKYYKSKLSKVVIEQDVSLLKEVLESEIFLQTDLTLEILAKKLNVSTHHLSQLFTVGLDSNFNKTINSYRIQYALELLKDSNNKSTIEEIGLDSGFNSRASFYRAFNATFNMTPSDFRKTVKRNL